MLCISDLLTVQIKIINIIVARYKECTNDGLHRYTLHNIIIIVIRGHLQTEFSTLNVIVTLTF